MKAATLLHLLFIFLTTRSLVGRELSFDDGDELSIPEDAVGRPPLPLRDNNIPSVNVNSSNLCHCTYGEGVCDSNQTCVKHPMAACFHAVEEVYNRVSQQMETWHLYGCASMEKGSDASHLTCNSWRSSHFHPKSIACCYEGDYCNRHIEPPPYANANDENQDWILENPLKQSRTFILAVILTIALPVTAMIVLYLCYSKRKKAAEKKARELEEEMEKQPILCDDSGSGSGSGKTTLNQRTVAQSLSIIKVIGRGRYGEVRKALYRGSYVAVKTFYTTDEESWRNEREIYQTHLLNHENILQYVAADIYSEDSITQMLLITDYHELGSLCDYLRREDTLTIDEALQLTYSCICGIEHLHAAVHGTGSRKKPEMAHRDIKSKNIIVKRPGVCCLADFGLAVRYEGRLIPEKVNVQVGTKRYMAPEVLSKSLNPTFFSQFKMADMYSFALVMWEIARRVEWQPLPDPLSSEIDLIREKGFSHMEGDIGQSLSKTSMTPSQAPSLVPSGPYSVPFTVPSGTSTNTSKAQTSKDISPSNSSGYGSDGSSSASGGSREKIPTIIRNTQNDMDSSRVISEVVSDQASMGGDRSGVHTMSSTLPLGPSTGSSRSSTVPSGLFSVLSEVSTRDDSGPSDSSGYGSSGSAVTPTIIRHPQNIKEDMKTRAMPYVPPFEGMVENDPSFDEMRKIVCEEQKRPPLQVSWHNGSNSYLLHFSHLMRDCWHSSPLCRHSALKVKKELSKVIEVLRNDQNEARSKKLSTSSHSASSSFTKRDTVDSGYRECHDALMV